MNSRIFRRIATACMLLIVFAWFSVRGQNGTSSGRREKQSNTRLSQLVEANVIATHAYQVLLAKKSGKGDPNCYGSGKLSDSELEALVEEIRESTEIDRGSPVQNRQNQHFAHCCTVRRVVQGWAYFPTRLFDGTPWRVLCDQHTKCARNRFGDF